jgi:hypothetical protein
MRTGREDKATFFKGRSMKKTIQLFGVAGLAGFLLITTMSFVFALGNQPSAAPTIDPQTLAGVRVRDQEARDLILQANERILAPTEMDTPAAEPTPAPTSTNWPISPAAADAIVHLAAPGVTITVPPVLVDFQGTPAYEVQTILGPVYVDAVTGKILYNGTLRISENAVPSSGSGGGGAGRARDGDRGDSGHDD